MTDYTNVVGETLKLGGATETAGGLALETADEHAPSGAVLHPSRIFLDGLFEPGDYICLLFIHHLTQDTKTRFLPVENFAARLFELGNWNSHGYNMYVGVNPYLPLARERSKENIAIVRNTRVSWGEFGQNAELAARKIESDYLAGLIPSPRFIIESSPGTRHVIFRLKNSVSIMQLEALNTAIWDEYGCDRVCVDATDAVLLPGFRNHEQNDSPVVKILSQGSDERHGLEEFKIYAAETLELQPEVEPVANPVEPEVKYYAQSESQPRLQPVAQPAEQRAPRLSAQPGAGPTKTPIAQEEIRGSGMATALDPPPPPKPTPDLAEIKRAMTVLVAKGSGRVVELRALNTPQKTWSGYYDNSALAKDTYDLSLREDVPNVYWTLQEIDPELIARRKNAAEGWAKTTTADNEVVRYVYLPIDFDPKRPSGISSTNAEKHLAFQLANTVRSFLLARGIPTILADSGNGYHLLARINMPVNRDSTALVKEILRVLAKRFGTEEVCIDTGLYNPARILKAYGSVARKGDHSAERPWRVSKILDAPENVEVVSEETLRALACELTETTAVPKPSAQTSLIVSSPGPVTAEMMENEMARLGISHGSRMDYKDGFKWQLAECPFCPEHKSPDSFLAWEQSGLHYFHCSHNSCAENRGSKEAWKRFKRTVGGFSFNGCSGGGNAPVKTAVLPWGEPAAFNTALPPIIPFQLKFLPHCLRALALDVAERMCVPLEFTAIALITGLAGVVNRRVFVYPKRFDKTWREALNLWGGVIAKPGQLKSPMMNAILKPHNRVSMDWDLRGREEKAKYESEQNAFKEQQKLDRKDKKNGSAEIITDEKIPPLEPVARQFMTNDATPEILHQIMAENPEGLFVVRDELSGWVAELDKDGREQQRELFLSGWNGDQHHKVQRVERGSFSAVMCLSLFGGFQPSTTRAFLEGGNNVTDGTFPRFGLLVWPDEIPYENRDRKPDEAAIESVEKLVRHCVEMRAEEMAFNFAEAAQQMFDDWLIAHQRKVEKEPSPHKQAHLAKYRGMLPKLAALFQLADTLANQPHTFFLGTQLIDAEHLQQAIDLCVCLESHMHRIYSCVKDPFQKAEESLAEHIKNGDLSEGFTARRVVRKRWEGLLTSEAIEFALMSMEDMRWIRLLARQEGRGRPTDRWEINPVFKPKGV